MKSILNFAAFAFGTMLFFHCATLDLSAQTEKMLADRGNQMYKDGQFSEAELNYRRSLREEEETDLDAAIYNLGNTLYEQKRYEEAVTQFNGVVSKVRDRGIRNKAYHNLGNIYLEQKNYEEAIEMYKEALRLNPNDQDARYNLAYAKKQLENESEEEKEERQEENQCDNPKENEDGEQQEQKEQKENQENKENQEQQDQNKEGEQQDQEQQEQNQNSEQEEEKEGEEKKEGEEEEKEGEKEDSLQQQQEGEEQDSLDQEPQPGDPSDGQGEPQQANLSKEQIMQMLEALKNEELKVQEKLRKKGKGRPIRTDKDW